MTHQTRMRNITESYIYRVVILGLSIASIVGVHLIADSQYMVRKIYDYYPAYFSIFIFTIFIFFVINLRSPEALIFNIWKCIGYGALYGYLAGILGYLFAMTVDIFAVKQHSDSFFTHFAQSPFEYLAVILSYPAIVLKSWLYGGLVGLSMFFLFRLSEVVLPRNKI